MLVRVPRGFGGPLFFVDAIFPDLCVAPSIRLVRFLTRGWPRKRRAVDWSESNGGSARCL
jgi:hypothetical protein